MVGYFLGGVVVFFLMMFVCGDFIIFGIFLMVVECWGYGCVFCVDRGLVIYFCYKNIYNVVL